MMRIPPRLSVSIIAASSLLASLATAENPPPAPEMPEHQVQLDERDLQLITMEVLKSQPMLSASPGIKAVDASRGHSSVGGEGQTVEEVIANVIFYPHQESRGVKQAFQAHCRRSAPGNDWECLQIEIRRYVRLDTQDFEVRVSANLDLASILALIEATRQPAAVLAAEASEVADTASSIFGTSEGYVVSWGHDGDGRVGLMANLRAGGNPAEPSDWRVAKLPEL